MSAFEFAEPVPSWRVKAVDLPADAAILDLGYEVAFPFLASPPDEAAGQFDPAQISR
jgi:hypothetical protein